MKGHLDRTKVVLRHLPPSITQAMLMEQIDTAFAGRYNWLSFRPGKSCQKHQVYSRAYINFKRPEDVIGFAEFFEGHVFVNEKGTQFKTVVEYAPSQRVPKQTSKKDGREGTILKDPEYLEFLELLAKPVENLPSAEIQLERREAERSGVVKDVPIVTPLMDYVRQKRASKGGSRRSMSNEKSSGRAGGSSGGSSSSAPSKRSSEKRRNSAAMYILRDAARSNSGKDKSTYLLRSKRDESQLSDKSIHSAVASGVEQLEEDNGAIGIAGAGKKKILLLKGKEREISHVSSGLSPEQSQVKDVISSTTVKQNQRHDVGGKIIRTILLNKDARQSQSAVQSESQAQTQHPAKDRRPPRAPSVQAVSKDTNGTMDEKVHGNGLSSFSGEKLERRARNKDRPDRGVWAPLRRLDSSQAGDLSSPATASAHSTLDSPEGFRKSVGRRGQSQGGKDFDGSGSPLPSESKSSKRGSSSGHSSHEKQVWVQKSSSGS